jgi:hypothetical protein
MITQEQKAAIKDEIIATSLSGELNVGRGALEASFEGAQAEDENALDIMISVSEMSFCLCRLLSFSKLTPPHSWLLDFTLSHFFFN